MRQPNHQEQFSSNSITSGNAALDPEVAKTLTVGGVFSPSFLPGFSVSIDYYKIKVDDLIEQLTAQEILTACLNAGGAGSPECAQIERSSPTTWSSFTTSKTTNRFGKSAIR